MRRILLLLVLLLGSGLPARAQFINGSFEEPRFSPGSASVDIVHEDTVPGWDTTATDGQIEFWSDGFGGVASFRGAQHVELNATQVSTLFQDIAGIPAGSAVGFQFAHRGRQGVDTLRLTITDLGVNGSPGGGDDTVLFTNTYSTGNTAWAFYFGSGILALGNPVRFDFISVSSVGGASSGNFLDAANFGVGVPEPSTYALFAAGAVITLLRARARSRRS